MAYDAADERRRGAKLVPAMPPCAAVGKGHADARREALLPFCSHPPRPPSPSAEHRPAPPQTQIATRRTIHTHLFAMESAPRCPRLIGGRTGRFGPGSGRREVKRSAFSSNPVDLCGGRTPRSCPPATGGLIPYGVVCSKPPGESASPRASRERCTVSTQSARSASGVSSAAVLHAQSSRSLSRSSWSNGALNCRSASLCWN